MPARRHPTAALITVIALGVVLVVAWDGFCLRDLIRADLATVRYLDKGTWAIICLLSCPWGGLLYMIAPLRRRPGRRSS